MTFLPDIKDDTVISFVAACLPPAYPLMALRTFPVLAMNKGGKPHGR
jgi:hypothetical protein